MVAFGVGSSSQDSSDSNQKCIPIIEKLVHIPVAESRRSAVRIAGCRIHSLDDMYSLGGNLLKCSKAGWQEVAACVFQHP
jgi:hypothetical protein